MVSNRCEMDSDMKISGGINLNAVDLFKDQRDLIRFCDLVQKSAKDTLLEMEREIVQILKQRRERSNDLQTERDRADVGRDTVHGQPRGAEAARTADRQVGQGVAGVGTHGISDRGTDTRDSGSVADNPEGDRRGGGEPLSGVGRAVPGGEPAPRLKTVRKRAALFMWAFQMNSRPLKRNLLRKRRSPPTSRLLRKSLL